MTDENTISSIGQVAKDSLKSYIERYERLDEEKKGIAEDQKELMAGAKAEGFDPKIIREVLKIRKMEAAERQEQEALLELYLHAVGMV